MNYKKSEVSKLHTHILQKIIKRDLEKLKAEISAYSTEENLWKIDKNISNSAGNLCLHLIGNLNTYLGIALRKSGYVRNRELEFLDKNIPKQVLLNKIETTIAMVNVTFAGLTDDDLILEYPMEVSVGKTTIGYYLTHITVHLGYHLGQINYHRRLLDK
ncbi:MAG: DinB family protein [Limnohabitans sp.]|nr:DinB family protein [Limnohabitans sp.]